MLKRLIKMTIVIFALYMTACNASDQNDTSAGKKSPEENNLGIAPPELLPSEEELKELEELHKDWKKRLVIKETEEDPGKIVGGEPVKPGQFPWAVAFHYYSIKENRWKQYCGGSLLDSEWVLSAAHCPIRKSHVVVIGRIDLRNNDGMVHKIKRVIKHDDYSYKTKDSDIALIKLQTPSKETAVRLLDNAELMKAETESTVIGWGHTKEGGSSSPVLKKVDVPIVARETCKKNFAKIFSKITDNMFCAGQYLKDSCQNDSGGGLFVLDEDKEGEFRYHLAGIVSFGHGCAKQDFPGVYTKVMNYHDWIDQTIAGN